MYFELVTKLIKAIGRIEATNRCCVQTCRRRRREQKTYRKSAHASKLFGSASRSYRQGSSI